MVQLSDKVFPSLKDLCPWCVLTLTSIQSFFSRQKFSNRFPIGNEHLGPSLGFLFGELIISQELIEKVFLYRDVGRASPKCVQTSSVMLRSDRSDCCCHGMAVPVVKRV